MTRPELSRDGRTLTVRVPFVVRKRSGRKLVVAPDGASWAAPRPRVDSAMVKALARAFRWKRMLESGRFASLSELAEAEKITLPYLSRILRLTLLTPEIVEMTLDGRQPVELSLKTLMKPFPTVWGAQRSTLLDSKPTSEDLQ